MSTGAPRRTPYSPEFRARHRVGADERPVAAPGGRGLGGDHNTIRRWLCQAGNDTGQWPGLAADERAELARLRRENVLLREEPETLKTAAMFFAHESATR